MANRPLKLNSQGYTLIEMAIVTLIMGVMATAVIMANRYTNMQSVANADRTFCTEKSIQMYEELRALVNGNESLGVGVLDNYNQGSKTFDYVLTTDKNVDTGLPSANPADPLSGNIKSNGQWRYERQVEVDRVANDAYARQVTIRIFLNPAIYAPTDQGQTGELLATVGGIMRTSAQPYEASQVLDVYILQINNIPAWWDVMPSLSTDMDNALTDLQSRLPDLILRTHFITRSSYGRDPLYQPETNSSNNPTESTPQQWVYFYPGFVPQDSPAADYYYYDPNTDTDPDSLLMDGNFMVDGTSFPVSQSQFSSGVATANISYSAADQYNNAMRYPDELATYQAVTAASALIGGVKNEGATEISERMLFEDMLSEPQSFENSIIVNLHGELLPLPPMRDYSDAAKDPGNQLVTLGQAACTIAASGINPGGDTNVRVVTHPELIYYPGASNTATAVTVRLRVYAYYDSEDEGGTYPSGDPRVPAISLFLPDAQARVVGVTAIIGNSTLAYSYQTPSPVGFTVPPSTYSGVITADVLSNPMSMSVSYIGPISGSTEQTLITLYNTPLTCPLNTSGNGGLNPEDALYGENYIPCSPDQTTSTSNLTTATYEANDYNFGDDLGNDNTRAVTAQGNPKNTARWIISLAMPITTILVNPATIYSGVYSVGATIAGIHAIETYLGNGVTSNTFVSGGVTTTVYPDMSRTYVWCGDAFMPPYTEQYQFMGDPRDCPYFDVKVGGVSIAGASVTIGPNAYNWWFKNDNRNGPMSIDGYLGFNQANGGAPWAGNINIDMPRYYQIIREGLLNTSSIWTTTNGWAFYYYGLGGEIGFDHPPMSKGVTIMSYPFQKSIVGESLQGYDSINGDGKTSGAVTGTWVASNVRGSAGVTWYQRSWLGELYPDTSYLDSWVTYGNLPTVMNTTISAPETFYLEPKQNVAIPSYGGQSDDGFGDTTYYPMAGGTGDNSFYNGENSSTNGTVNHYGDGDTNSDELSLGVTTYNIIPFPLPNVVDVNRPWDFGGSTPPEWSDAPYPSMRTTVSNPSISGTARLFYDFGGNGSSTPHGSGVVQITSTNGGVTQVGYVIETGTAPSGNVGAQTLAETDLVYAMRTFLDGGLMAAAGKPGHIVQIPLVKIFLNSSVPEYSEGQTVSFTVGSPVTATKNGQGAVSVGDPVTDIWWRYDPYGLANYYDEDYPNYGAAMTGTGMYQESVSVIYNLKYSADGGDTWKFVQDDSAAVTGVCNSSAAYAIAMTAPWPYNWPVSTGTRVLAQGDYLLRVEAYRKNYGEHYAFDMTNIEISW